MTIIAIDHVQLAMPAGAEAEARAFYADLLGIPEAAKPAELARRGGAWFERGALKIHLGVETDFRPARKAHPGLLVSDLAGLLERLERAGVSVTRAASLPEYERAFVSDPFGNRIELLEPKR
ncbi:MAG TPA: VOC family protein [Polyangiaceae bacterium]|jgi:catechol 2,3-dioxygenase-like lactoylglutathione lyase family enzyme|nr:VOC family protein [Polyangiaceae bacterium]